MFAGFANLFQSTRPRGRTRRNSTPGPFCGHGFNPRVLAGGRDFTFLPIIILLTGFNPRVLAGGRDLYPRRFPTVFSSFNPRVLAGGRDDFRIPGQIPHQFQSTRPRGRTRHITQGGPSDKESFNPRVLAGGRDLESFDRFTVGKFQSTRPRGRTRPPPRYSCPVVTMFQSTRPRGRTRPKTA